jgi:glycosyltransferase involved in cell wall biosynthesis
MASVPAPAISVIVRTLGSPRLGEALESLARQTRRDFEVILVDMSGGRAAPSLARSRTVLPAVQSVVFERPIPRPAALNAGIRAARAERIGILDDDNLYDPPHLDRLLAGLEEGADYVYTGVRHSTFTEEGQLIETHEVSLPFEFRRVALGNYIYSTGSAFRKSLWERVGGYDERFTVFEDWDFIIRAAQTGTFQHLPAVSGESRKFTGLQGASRFHLEVAATRRCMAGVYWKHRHLFRDDLRRDLKRISAVHCRNRIPARTGWLASEVGGWRLELGLDLLAWWAREAFRPGSRRRALRQKVQLDVNPPI